MIESQIDLSNARDYAIAQQWWKRFNANTGTFLEETECT